MADDDTMTQIRELLILSNFKKALAMSDSVVPSTDVAEAELEALKARAKLFSGDAKGIEAFKNSSDPALVAIALQSDFLNGGDRKATVEALKDLCQSSHNPTAKVILATCLAAEDDLQQALSVTSENATMEMQAVHTYLLLMMDRVDLAAQHLQSMNSVNEDAAAAKIGSCWLNQMAGDYQEAYLTYCDLQSQFQMGLDNGEDMSTTLLNGMAVANLARCNWQEALEDLQKAQKVAPNDSSTAANIVTTYRHLKQHEDAEKAFTELAKKDPLHPLVQKSQNIDVAFERFAAQA